MRKLTQADFLQRAFDAFGDRYSYEYCEYNGHLHKVTVTCREHGNFEQLPQAHLMGREGCRQCPNPTIKTTSKFISKALAEHGDACRYDRVVYRDWYTPVSIYCFAHRGYFEQRPYAHVRGHGCPLCNPGRPVTQEEWVTRCSAVHQERYDYSRSVYLRGDTKLDIICSEHGVFQQRAMNHLQGQGCPRCRTAKQSKMERRWLMEMGVPDDPEHRQVKTRLPSANRTVWLDGYDPATKTAYLFHGDFWHGNPEVYPPDGYNVRAKMSFEELHHRTLKMEDDLRREGIHVVVMWEHDFKKDRHWRDRT